MDSDSASDIFPNFNLDLFPRLLEESNNNLLLILLVSFVFLEIVMIMINW